jgi:FkbM family methyltransferase
VRTHESFLSELSAPQGVVTGLPVPGDIHAETVEWIGLLKSIADARRRFVGMELGAGWGPWGVDAVAAARHIGITDIRLTAVEADPGHYEFTLRHFRNNGLDPSEHCLLQAAVSTLAGRARWPRSDAPSAEWGARPVVDATATRDHLGRAVSDWIDVELVSFADLLLPHPTWNLVHIDVQGWEVGLCESAAALLDERVRWLVIATHDPKLHGDIMNEMHLRGWELENEKPPRLNWRSGAPTLQSMVSVDGTQGWRNPRLQVSAEAAGGSAAVVSPLANASGSIAGSA